MMKTRLARSAALCTLVVLIPACGGNGGTGANPSGGPQGPILLLSEDFSSGNLSNWTVSGQMVFDGSNGNPMPAMQHQGGVNGQASSQLGLNVSGGLTISFDYKMTTASGTVAFGGLNSGTIAAPGHGAGFSISESSLSCVLNGADVNTAIPPNTANWNTFRIVILPSGLVEYYVNSVLIFTSAGTISIASNKEVLFQVTGTSFGNLSFIDNVKVTAP